MEASVPSHPIALQSGRQAVLFQRLRWRLLANSWHLFLGQSSLRPFTILLCSLVVWVFVFLISWFGFRFLRLIANIPLGGDIVATVFDVLFFSLGLFLVFSTGLILYSSLFNSAETNFLLSKPVAADQVFAYKYQGALAFSSSAFLLLGSPVLIAYGLVHLAPWPFYVYLPLFFLGFVLLPGSVGALICLLIVNFVPRRRRQVVILLIVVLLALAGWWLYRLGRLPRPGVLDREDVSRILSRFTFSSSTLIPSHWVARGLHAAGNARPIRALYYLALVWSNGLFLYLLTAAVSSRLYRRGYNRLSTGSELVRKPGGRWLDALFAACLPLVRPSTRLMLVKDFRTFRRDPQQWVQILIFSGLMLLYILNIRRMFTIGIQWQYQNSISLLNLFAVALLLCTYTGRFIYPLLSLEGRKFWILGLLPLRREQLLWGKFAFSLTGTLLLAEVLIVLSDVMLDMPVPVLLLHALTVLVLAAGLSGLSVGLGAVMPNFRETDPSKIAVGFGGTLNLVASLLFVIVVLVLMAGPWHVLMFRADSGNDPLQNQALVWLGAGLGVLVGGLAVALPLRAGVATLRKMEF